MNNPIITTLLDNDFYKFLMQQVFFHKFPSASSKYSFKLRNNGVSLSHIRHYLDIELDNLCNLTFTDDELQYLTSLQINNVRVFKPSYINMLKNFKLDRKNIQVFCQGENMEIIAEGVLYEVMFFEIFVLAIVNELYFRHSGITPNYEKSFEHYIKKMDRLNDLNMMSKNQVNYVNFIDFGTRRRYSKEWQYKIVAECQKQKNIFSGTSNVFLSKKFGTMPVGTMAHEYLQAMQVLAKNGLINSQKEALEIWLNEYRGILAIALTDVIGMDSFLRDFDYLLSKSYDGTRHDSGDPFWWADLQIDHYKKFNIDPKTKKLVFSDGLNVSKIESLYKKYCNVIQLIFGWGTNLTNDMIYDNNNVLKALNIVMKIIECNNQPVVKLSDSDGKTMCEDQNYINYVKHIFKK